MLPRSWGEGVSLAVAPRTVSKTHEFRKPLREPPWRDRNRVREHTLRRDTRRGARQEIERAARALGERSRRTDRPRRLQEVSARFDRYKRAASPAGAHRRARLREWRFRSRRRLDLGGALPASARSSRQHEH